MSNELEKAIEEKDKIKYITMQEFVEFGYLQEVNRRFLHPLGLALAVDVENNKITGIWDYRDDPEGMEFGFEERTPEQRQIAIEKRKRVDAEWQEKEDHRYHRFGGMIEEIPE